ncbi:MAG TPA: carboxypeptidase regulatory-like domain-containing protein [Acidobacteriaceae bacterium]
MSFRHIRILSLLTVLLALCFGNPSRAQTSNGELSGQVVDQTGGSVPGAKITLRNTSTSDTRQAIADGSGNFLFTQVPPAPYQLTVEGQGFQRFVQNGIVLLVGQHASVNPKLTLGEVSQSVEVTANATILDTSDASLGQSVENRKILDLPLNGRNIVALAALATGVTPGSGFGEGIPAGRSALIQAAASNILINGGMTATNDVLIDGVPLSICCQNQIAFLPSIDTTEEFRVRTNMFDAQFGRTGGGIISYATRSGTNEFHGSVFEFIRNAVFDANTYFNNRNHIPVGKYTYNQFGGRIGGPVLHNKLFFFGDYEGIRNRRANTLSGNVPTAAQRAGQFTTPIYDPLTSTLAGGVYTRTAFTNNTIPTNRINSVAAAVLKLYPLPNSTTVGSNYTAVAPATDIEDQFTVRMDYSLSSNDKLFARFSYNHNNGNLPDWFGNVGSPGVFAQQIRNTNIAVNETHTFSSKFLVNLLYGYTKQNNVRAPRSEGTDLTAFGWPAAFSGSRQDNTLPQFSVTGYLGLSSNALYIRVSDVNMIAASFDKILGRHDLKFGFDGRRYNADWVVNNTPAGTFAFNTGFTRGPNALSGAGGDSIASFLLGYPASGSATYVSEFVSPDFYSGLYLQDDFKINEKLTVNAGLRWEVETPRTEQQNRLSYFDPNVASPLAGPTGITGLKGGLQFLGVNGNPARQQDTDMNNFGPRIGFAWHPLNKLVTRGGYGIVYLPITGRFNTATNQGFATSTTYLATTNGGVTPAGTLSDPFPNGISKPNGSSDGLMSSLGQAFSTLRRNDPVSYAQQWSLSVQESLRDDLVIEAAYTGSKGTKLPMPLDLNTLPSSLLSQGSSLLTQVANPFQPYVGSGTLSAATVTRLQLLKPFPQFLGITDVGADIGSSTYHALTLRLEKRLTRGFSVLTAFTGGKLITDTTPWIVNYLDSAPGYQDLYNRRADRSVAPDDIARRLVVSYVYELPFGHGKQFLSRAPRAVDLLLGGWQLNGITTYSTGQPVVITNSVSTTSGATRPNTNGKWILPGDEHARLTQWFDKTAFSAPDAFGFGNTPRTLPNLRTGKTKNWDMSLFKNFDILEHLKGQFRAEVFNIFNTPRFAPPNGSYGTSAFGTVTSQANDAREMQLALRLSF